MSKKKQLTPDQDPVYQTGQSRVVHGFSDAGRDPGHRDSSTWGQSRSVVTTSKARAKRLHCDYSIWGQGWSVVTTMDCGLILPQRSPQKKAKRLPRHSQQYKKLPQHSPQKKQKDCHDTHHHPLTIDIGNALHAPCPEVKNQLRFISERYFASRYRL